jgi:hypothetical protein
MKKKGVWIFFGGTLELLLWKIDEGLLLGLITFYDNDVFFY